MLLYDLRLVELFDKSEGRVMGIQMMKLLVLHQFQTSEGSSKQFDLVFDELKKISQKHDLLTEELNAFKTSIDKKFDTVFVCLRMMFEKFKIHIIDGDDDEV